MNLKTAFFGLLAAALCFTLSGCKWEDDNKTPAPAPSGYEITVYNEGVAQKVDAESYSVEGDVISYQKKLKDNAGSESGSAKGAWVVKHNAWKSAPSEKRYNVTLYNGGKAVGSWAVRSFVSTDSQSVFLFPADGSEVLRVSGEVVVRSLKSGSVATAKSRVTVYNGDSVVYKAELSSHAVFGQHLEAEAADGSGTVFIWGRYKVENLD